MAGENRVPYIIDIEASFDKFKQQMKSGEAFNKGDIKAFNSFLTKALKTVNAEASQVGVNLQKGLNVNTSDLEKKLQFISGIFDEMGKAKNPISDWAEKGKGVYREFNNLQTSVATLAQNVATMQTGLNNLTTAFKDFSDAYKSFDPTKFASVVKPLEGIDVAGMKNASEQTSKYTKDIKELQVELDELSKTDVKIKFNTKNIAKEFRGVLSQIDSVEDEISRISDAMVGGSELSADEYDKKMIALAKKEAEKAKLYRKMQIMDSHYKKSSGASLFYDEGIIEDPKAIIAEAKKKLSETIGALNKELPKSTQKGVQAGVPVGIDFKIPSEKDLIGIINTCIDNINSSKSLHKIKVNLDDTANIIEDKTKRAYGDASADEDVNTTKLVTQTESRFDRIATAIQKKQDKILYDTKTWRNQMLEQFKFKSGDFDFKFNDTLVESLQTLFDDYALKVNIDPQYLADQIKTVLSDGGVSLGSGTANIDANSMAMAIAIGLKAVLTGEMPQVAISGGNVDDNSDVPEEVTHIATEIKQSARHLDLAEDYVKDVVDKLYAVSKYAAKDTKGSVATKNLFDSLGINLSKIKTAGDVGNSAEIVSIIENSLLQRDEFGNLKGSTLPSELSSFKGSSSKTIPAFLSSMDEVFFMLQEDTQTVEEWTRKRHDRDIFDSARGKANATSALRDVRSPIRQGDIPNKQSIQTAIDLMADIGQNTDSLQVLKTAREALGEKTDDASIEEFKTAAKTFYDSSTKTFWDLKKQAEDTFKGTVYFQGKNGKTYSKYMDSYKQVAGIKEDAVIVDVQVSSSLNNVTLGTVKSKYSNRTSQAEEKRLMRDAARPDFIVPREYEKDILNKELTYKGFRAQNTASVPIDFDATIEGRKKTIVESENTIIGLQENLALLEQEVKSKQAEVETLKKTLDLIGVEPTYKRHATDDYGKRFDTLYSLNRNSKVTSEANLPKEGYSTEISDAINKKAVLNDRLAKLSEQARLIENLTIEQAQARLKIISERLVPDEEMALYQKFLNNPIDKDVLKKSSDIKGYSKEEIQKLRKIPIDEINKFFESGRVQRESMDLYSRFIQNPDSVRNNISSSIQQVTQEATSNQKNLDSYILTWAKSEEAKIPEAEAMLKRAAEKVLSKIGSTMNSLYKDMISTEEKLKSNISDDERIVLTAHIQDLFKTFTQAQEEYDNLIRQNKITRKKPLGEDRLKNITSLQSQYSGSVRNELSGTMSSITSEIIELNTQKSKLRQQELEATSQREHGESLIQRAEAEKEYNKLLEKSLMLQGSIEKMEADEESEKKIERKRKQLEKVNNELAKVEAKVQELGGFLGRGNEKEYSDSERKSYALNELKKIENDLITARAQKRVSESRISKKDREIADLDKWGLGAGIGASELGKTKGRLTSEFMSGDYVQSQVNSLREKTKAAIAEAENRSREIFDKKVAVAMEHLNWNPLDQTQVQKFLNTKHGQQLSSDFASEVDTNTTNLWKQYDEYRKDLLTKLKTEFQDSFKTNKGVLTATSKTQDETGQWINEIVEVRVKESLRARLEEEKRILETKNEPIQGNIDRLEADKAAAIEYGGIGDKELLSSEIIKDQINKEIELTTWKEKQIAAQEKLNELEAANVDHSDQIYKDTKKDLKEAEKQVGWYELLVKNRQKLVQMRYDESKESTYTDEEKKLHFTNQIVTYNQKIEDSLVKQKELTEQIKSATGDEKTKLQRRLSIEEENVAKWREKIPTYESKLNKLNTAKPKETTSAILPEGGIVGSIASAVSEVIGGLGDGIEINTEDLAKEATLRAVLEVLGGVPSGLGRGTDGLGRGDDEQVANPKSLYKSWNVKPQDLDFDTVKTKAVALKQVIDSLYDEGKSDTQEFIDAQTELSKLLSGWRNKIGKTTNPELYGKTGKENWMSYLTSGDTKIFDNLDNVELSSVSQKDYLSRLKSIGVEQTVSKPEIKEAEATLQIKDFDEFKLQAQALKKAIEAEVTGSEEQKKIQVALVQVLQTWARSEASGFGGKLPNVEQWKAYLTGTGVFDKINTSVTPLTNRQLNKGTKAKDVVVEKPEQKKKRSKKTEVHTESRQPETRQATGGLIQIVSQLATENTLLQVLSALQTLGTTEGGVTAPTAAGDLYNQFKALLLGGSIDDHERLAYMNSETGAISGNVIGKIANISDELIRALRAKYPAAQGFDTQVHTHGKSSKPYFSTEDYNHFTKDYESGIKKQVLLTKDHISVLDLSAVKSAEEVQALMDELIKAGNNAKAIKKVFENNKSGAMYESAKFDSLNANSLVKMIGANVDKPKDSNNAFESYISKIQEYKKVIENAQADGYLMDNDINVKRFTEASNEIDKLIKSVANGVPVTDEMKANFEQLYRNTIDYGNAVNKTIGKNKNMYSGLSEINSVNKQRDKIIGTFGEDRFNDSSVTLVKQYNAAYEALHKTYKDFAEDRTLYDTKHQEQLHRQATGVQNLGNKLMASIAQADDLRQKANQSGFYLNKQTGQEEWLGGISNPLTVEEASVKNLESTMRNYVQNTLKQANIENVKFNSTKQQLIYTFRTSKDTVADMVVQYNAAENALFAYNKQERESLTGWRSFIQGMKSKIKSITQYMFSITSITRIWGEIRQGIQYIREIDSALTELKKVTDETEETYDRFLDTAAKTADKIGSTIKEVVSSTADFARLGYSMQEAATMAESAQVLMNVSEFTDISTATDSLISSIQAFKYTANESMDVVDILNTIGNNYAISTADLATSLTKSSGSLVAANGTLEEAVALTATANTIIQDADVVGTALKTVAMRLRGTDTQTMEEEGLEVDGVVTSKSKLRGKISALSGVDILTDTGAYKSTYQILSEIAKVWEDIDDMDQAALLELLAGKRAGSVMSAILQNPETLKDAFESANDAAGSALAENEKYLDSIQGRIDLFNNAIQTMWSNALSDGFIKFIVNVGTQLIKLIDSLGLIKTLVIGIGTYLIQKHFKGNLFGGLFGDTSSIKSIKKQITDLEATYERAKAKFQASPTDKNREAMKNAESNLNVFKETNRPILDIDAKKTELNEQLEKLKAERQQLQGDLQVAKNDLVDITTNGVQEDLRNYVEVDTSHIDNEIAGVQERLDIARQQLADAKSATWDDYKALGSVTPAKDRDNRIDEKAAEVKELEKELDNLQIKKDEFMSSEIDNVVSDGARAQVQDLTNKIDDTDKAIQQTELELKKVEIQANATGNAGMTAGQKFKAGFITAGKSVLQFGKTMLKSMATMYVITTIMELFAEFGHMAEDWVDSWVETPEEAQEEFERLNEELSSVKSELNSLNSELKTTQDRIDELMSQDSLSLVEQEELEKLRAENDELERKIKLNEALEESKQEGVNAAAINATDKYISNTSFGSDKTKAQSQEEAKETGSTIGKAIGLVLGGLVVAGITVASGGTLTIPALALGGMIGGVTGDMVGGAIGSGVAGASYDSEQSVGEAMDNMVDQRTELQKAQEDALANKDVEAYNEATEALSKYDEQMSEHITQIQANYNAMDWSAATDEQKKKMIEYADWLDKYSISMGATDAKSNAITRVFGDEAEGGFAKAKDKINELKENLKEAYATEDELAIEKALSDLENFKLDEILSDEEIERLRNMGIYLYEAEDSLRDVIKAESKFIDGDLEDVAKDINKIADGLGSLKSAFDEVIDKGVLTAKTVMELKEALKIQDGSEELTDAWREYLDIMMSGVATTEEMTLATEKFAQTYLEDALKNNSLTPDTKLEYVAQLRVLGVDNAEEVIDDMLQRNMVDEIKGQMSVDTEAVKTEFFEKNGRDSSTVREWKAISQSEDKVRDLAERYGLLGDVSDEVKQDIIKRYGVEEDAIDAILAKLEEKQKLENDISATKKQQKAYNDWHKAYEVTKQDLGDFNPDQWESSAYNMAGEVTYYRKKGQTNANATNISAEQYNKLKELYDKYQELITQGNNSGYIIDGKVVDPDFQTKIDELQGEIDGIETEIEEELTVDIELKLELQDKSELVDQFQEIYDTLASAEKEYNENKGYVSVDTLQSLLQLEPKYLSMLYDENGQLNLNKQTLLQVAQARTLDMGIQAAQNVITQASEALEANKIDRLREMTEVTYNQADANWALVQSNLAALKSTIETRNMDVNDEMYGQLGGVYEGIESQVFAIQDLTNRAVSNISNSFSSSGNTAKAEVEDAFQKAMDYWENRIGANQARYEQVQNEIDLLEKKGKIAGKEYYQEQINLENQRLSLLNQQKAEAKKFLSTFKEGSDEWWEVANQLNDIEGDIDDVTGSIQDLRDAMAEVDWQIFEETHTRFDDLIGQLDTVRELLSADEDTLFDDEGQWTEDGVAVLGTSIQQLAMYEDGLRRVNEELEKFQQPYTGNEADYAKIGIDSEQEYYDRLKQLTDEQYDYAKAVSDTEQSVVDMYESQVDAIEEYTSELVDAYNDYIDVVHEALDAERDLYKFKKDIQKQTKDIASLERRIASLSGSDNASDIAERRKLEAELYDAKEGLNDTYYDHAKDSQSQALDNEATAYEESMTNYIDTLRKKLDEAKLNMDLFMEQVTTSVTTNAGTVLKKYQDTGIEMSAALTKPWQDAANKIAEFGGAEGALASMNNWTKTGENGFVYNFSTNATSQLTSPWNEGSKAIDSFKSSVKTGMENVVSNIRTNVATGVEELNKLKTVQASITDTTVKAPAPSGNSNGNGNTSGSTGNPSVAALQQILNGVFNANLTVDGLIGPKTTQAIRDAQSTIANASSAFNSPVNGKYNSKTKENIASYIDMLIHNLRYRSNGSSMNGQMIQQYTTWKNSLPATFHAKGTLGTKRDELAITDESWIGEEITLAAGKNGQLQYLKKGSAVMPADISANLIEWGKLNPDMMKVGVGTNFNMISNAINKPEFNLSFDALVKADRIDEGTLPEIKRYVTQEINSLVKQMNYAIKGYAR